MKKTAVVTVILAIIMAVSGCMPLTVKTATQSAQPTAAETPALSTEQPSPSPSASEIPSASVSEEVSATPSALASNDPMRLCTSFFSFVRILDKGIKNINAKTKNNKSLNHVDIIAKGVAGCTVFAMALTAFGGKNALSTLKSAGFSDIETSQADRSFVIDYKGPDGKDYEQTCKYYPINDSMQSVIRDKSGNIIMFFEYVNTGKGYALQAFELNSGGGGYMRFRSFFDSQGEIAAGIMTADKPESMFDYSGFTSDYVKDSYMYFILKGKTFIVSEDDKTTET